MIAEVEERVVGGRVCHRELNYRFELIFRFSFLFLLHLECSM